jgi:hypothetical protein
VNSNVSRGIHFILLSFGILRFRKKKEEKKEFVEKINIVQWKYVGTGYDDFLLCYVCSCCVVW